MKPGRSGRRKMRPKGIKRRKRRRAEAAFYSHVSFVKTTWIYCAGTDRHLHDQVRVVILLSVI